eukprot:gene9667-1874_t
MKSIFKLYKPTTQLNKQVYSKTSSSNQWMERQTTDPYVKKRIKEGYRSRAAFKLIEMDDKFKFLKQDVIIELGAAPGSWTQIARERMNEGGKIIAVDLDFISPFQEKRNNVQIVNIEGDFTKEETMEKIIEELNQKKINLVLSDMAPKTSGIQQMDHGNMMKLAYTALEFSKWVLKKNGIFLVKIFSGSEESSFKTKLKLNFKSVKSVKPKSSRGNSTEIYYLCEEKDEVPTGWLNLTGAKITNVKGTYRIEIQLVKMTRQKQQKLLIEVSKNDYEEVYNTIQLATTIDSSSEVIFEGWLSKQGSLNWNERYFILRPWMLYYYTKKDSVDSIDEYDIHLLDDEEEMINELKKDSITEAAHGIIPIYPNTIIQHSLEPKGRKSSFFTFPNSPNPKEQSSGRRARSNSGKDTPLIYISNSVQSEKILTPVSSSPGTPNSSSPPMTPIKKRSSVVYEDSGNQFMKIATKDSSGSSKIYYFKHKDSDILDSWIKILQTSVIKHRVRRKRELIIENKNGKGSELLIKEIEKEREKYQNSMDINGYIPMKLILKGKYPFFASLDLDFPISIFGKGKVCIYSEEDDPVLKINSPNVWINNLTLRQKECENVSAVNVVSGYVFLEHFNSQSECDVLQCSFCNSNGGIKIKPGGYLNVEKSLISKNKEGIVVEEDGFLRMKESRIVENDIGLTSYALRNTSLFDNYFSKNLKMKSFFPLSFDDNMIHSEMTKDLKNLTTNSIHRNNMGNEASNVKFRVNPDIEDKETILKKIKNSNFRIIDNDCNHIIAISTKKNFVEFYNQQRDHNIIYFCSPEILEKSSMSVRELYENNLYPVFHQMACEIILNNKKEEKKWETLILENGGFIKRNGAHRYICLVTTNEMIKKNDSKILNFLSNKKDVRIISVEEMKKRVEAVYFKQKDFEVSIKELIHMDEIDVIWDDYRIFESFESRFKNISKKKNESKKIDFVHLIPIEIWISIFMFIEPEDFKQIRQTFHSFNSLFYDDSYWKIILESQLPKYPFIPKIDHHKVFKKERGFDYYHIYKNIYFPIFHDELMISKEIKKQGIEMSQEEIEKKTQIGFFMDHKLSKNSPLGCSKFGGKPDLPDSISWPLGFNFICQINLNDETIKNSLIFNHFFKGKIGILYFFSRGCAEEAKVYFYETNDRKSLKKIDFPSDKEEFFFNQKWNQCELKGFDVISNLRFGFDKYFDNVHFPHGAVEFFGTKSIFFEPEEDDIILLQLNSDDIMNTCWNDLGDLFFFIKQEDLENLNFENVTIMIDSG